MSEQGRGRRALFLDLLVPEPDRHASSVRVAQLLTLMREWGWRVDFLNCAPSDPPASTGLLDRLGVRLLPAMDMATIARHLAAHAADYALVYIAWVSVARRLMGVVRQAAPGKALLYDTHDVNHLREYRQARVNGNARTLARALRTRNSERAALLAADASLAITAADAAILGELAPAARLFTVGMWAEPDPVRRRPEPATLLFVGNMGAPHNHDCARFLAHEVLPLLRPGLPALCLVLAGPDHNELSQGVAGQDITITGWLADLRPQFERASLFVAPLRFGSGLKGKMLQAMAYGLPIVASRIAAEGMPLRDGHDFLLADTAAEVADAVRRLLADPAAAQALATAALRTLEEHYGRDLVAAQFARAVAAIA